MISDMNKMLSANHRKSMELMMMDDSSEQKSSDEIDDQMDFLDAIFAKGKKTTPLKAQKEEKIEDEKRRLSDNF